MFTDYAKGANDSSAVILQVDCPFFFTLTEVVDQFIVLQPGQN